MSESDKAKALLIKLAREMTETLAEKDLCIGEEYYRAALEKVNIILATLVGSK